MFSQALAALLATVPADFTVQGVLRADDGGAPVDGTYGLTLRLYDGAALLEDRSFPAVSVVDGVFSVIVKDVALGTLTGAGSLAVGVQVGTEPELPRQVVGAVPYASVATVALGLNCTACVEAAELAPTVTAALVSGMVASGQFWTKAEATSLADLLPADGLDEISGGLISTEFEDVFTSTDTPIAIKDNNPLGIGSTIDVPDVGLAKQLEVSVSITGHSNIGELVVVLYPPDGSTITLHNKTKTGPTLTLTLPPDPEVTGDVEAYEGTNIKGAWRLEVIDGSFDNNATDGVLAGWGISITTLSNQKLRITGDLDAEGHKITSLGAPGAPGDAANKAYVDAAFKERTKSQEFLAVPPGSKATLTHGFGTSFIVADAWFRAKPTDPWAKNGFYGTVIAGDGGDGPFNPASSTTLAGGDYDFTTFTIPSGVTVTVTGSTPLVVRSQAAVNITGTLMLDGAAGHTITGNENATGGAGGGGGGGNGGDCPYGGPGTAGSGLGGGVPGGTSSYGGGAGGAGHAFAGTAGSLHPNASSCIGMGSHGAGGLAVGSLEQGTLIGGSGGGGGGYGGANNAAGGGGGGGGGAVKISAPTIFVTGTIAARGGAGGSVLGDEDGGGGGGGAGGSVWLLADEVQITGTVVATGGVGGTASQSACFGGDGGAGSTGRVRIDALAVAGLTNPPYIGNGLFNGLALSPLRVHQPDSNSVSVHNHSLSPLDIRAIVIAP